MGFFPLPFLPKHSILKWTPFFPHFTIRRPQIILLSWIRWHLPRGRNNNGAGTYSLWIFPSLYYFSKTAIHELLALYCLWIWETDVHTAFWDFCWWKPFVFNTGNHLCPIGGGLSPQITTEIGLAAPPRLQTLSSYKRREWQITTDGFTPGWTGHA